CADPQLSQPGGLGISGLAFGIDQLARLAIGSFKFFVVDSTFCLQPPVLPACWKTSSSRSMPDLFPIGSSSLYPRKIYRCQPPPLSGSVVLVMPFAAVLGERDFGSA
ncbi:hypothetical protein, partial [Mesorhizobium sp. M7D.F.Ca.US.004.03.1.1]|uniref:hypothetical protein n=1 Tax=Mesorhizobium sp. M7D.F.Ca.US.004.03.1.1 TaxID=2496702 RepID=UPI0019D2AFD3